MKTIKLLSIVSILIFSALSCEEERLIPNEQEQTVVANKKKLDHAKSAQLDLSRVSKYTIFPLSFLSWFSWWFVVVRNKLE